MTSFSRLAAAAVSTVALGTLGLAAAPAAHAAPTHTPCAQQQAQLDRSEAKLAELTQRFQLHPTMKNKKAKKAQVKRVAHAQARLDSCVAQQSDGASGSSAA